MERNIAINTWIRVDVDSDDEARVMGDQIVQWIAETFNGKNTEEMPFSVSDEQLAGGALPFYQVLMKERLFERLFLEEWVQDENIAPLYEALEATLFAMEDVVRNCPDILAMQWNKFVNNAYVCLQQMRTGYVHQATVSQRHLSEAVNLFVLFGLKPDMLENFLQMSDEERAKKFKYGYVLKQLENHDFAGLRFLEEMRDRYGVISQQSVHFSSSSVASNPNAFDIATIVDDYEECKINAFFGIASLAMITQYALMAGLPLFDFSECADGAEDMLADVGGRLGKACSNYVDYVREQGCDKQ